jgi:hypothetical protein
MAQSFNRRQVLKMGALAGAGAALGPQIWVKRSVPAYAQGETIRVGILHSLSGTMAISETSVVDAEKLAIKEINAAGGVFGQADRADYLGWGFRLANLCRESHQIDRCGQGGNGIRLLDFGQSQSGFAGV